MQNAIILGASSIKQFEENLDAFNKSSLPNEILKAFNDANEFSKNVSPEYFYFH